MFRSTGISLCCLALLGCQTPKMMFYDDGAAMQREVVALVPPGTSVPEAKKTMKANGFSCIERKAPSQPTADDPGEGSLVCHYDQMTGIFGSYHLDVNFPCTEEGCIGEPTIDKLSATPGLCPKEHSPSDTPHPVDPAPLWTKVVAGTAMAALIVVTVPLWCLAMSHGCGCGH